MSTMLNGGGERALQNWLSIRVDTDPGEGDVGL